VCAGKTAYVDTRAEVVVADLWRLCDYCKL
jgi:hypothetical protein